MAIHPSIFAWEIPWTEEPGGLQFMGWQESDTTESVRVCTRTRAHTHTHTHTHTQSRYIMLGALCQHKWENYMPFSKEKTEPQGD